ncbi:GNAT family N-acetyltransferase [Streptomyces sp. DT24]
MRLLSDWAHEEGWNPGHADGPAFHATDPGGFLIGRIDGEPVSCVSVVRYGAAFGFLGFYLTRPHLRGRGYGTQLWRAGMERLAGRNVGLDGVVAQQANYRKSGFRSAWTTMRYEGVVPTGAELPDGVELIDARTLPFGRLTDYDRRFFPEARDSFLAHWIASPGHSALAAVGDGEVRGFAVLRACRGTASRIGPLYASSPEVATALLATLADTAPGEPVAIDVPDVNPAAVRLAEGLGLTPSFETARMYTGQVPGADHSGLYGITSLELG